MSGTTVSRFTASFATVWSRVNPLTVLKGYQQLVDEQLVESKRGRGMSSRTRP